MVHRVVVAMLGLFDTGEDLSLEIYICKYYINIDLDNISECMLHIYVISTTCFENVLGMVVCYSSTNWYYVLIFFTFIMYSNATSVIFTSSMHYKNHVLLLINIRGVTWYIVFIAAMFASNGNNTTIFF